MPLVKLIRPHQWIKNLLVFVPLVAGKNLSDYTLIAQGLLTFAIFSLVASAVYISNDIIDLANDRAHPTKKFRPIAAGKITPTAATALAIILLAAGFGLALVFFHWLVAAMMAGYYALSLAYSWRLKKIPIIDIVVLSFFYLSRVVVGGVALTIPISFWLIIFTLFLFFALSAVKRYVEIHRLKNLPAYKNITGRGYGPGDDMIIFTMGMAASFAALVILCLYFHENPYHFSYAYVMVLLWWLMRLWFYAQKNLVHDDPLLFAAKDKPSLLIFFLTAIAIFVDITLTN